MTISRLSYSSGARASTGSYEQVVPNLDARLLERMEPLFEVGANNGDGGSDELPSLSYSRFPDGSALISCAVGAEARALFLERGAAELGDLLPVDLWHSPLWERWGTASGVGLAAGWRPKPQDLVGFARDVEKQKAGRLERFLAEVRALFAPAPGRQLVLIAHPDDVAYFVRIACASLPAELATRLTFTTRCRDPRTAFQQIVGTPVVPNPAFSAPETQHQYRVHDLADGSSDSPAPEFPDEWARTLAGKWLDSGVKSADAQRLWNAPSATVPEPSPGTAVSEPPPARTASPEEPSGDAVAGRSPAPPRDRVPDETADPLARMAAWPTLAPPPSVQPAQLFANLRSAPQNAADTLKGAVGLDLGDIPYEHVQYLAKRLRDDADFVRACQGPLSALTDTRLPIGALRDLDQYTRGKARETLLAAGFQAMAPGPLSGLVPDDCVRLRTLFAAARTGLPETVLDTGSAAAVDASAHEVVQLIRAAQVTPVRGEGSPLTTALAVYWPESKGVWDTGVIPARAALKLIDGLSDLHADLLANKLPGLFDEAALDRLVEAALLAPAVDEAVIDLATRLIPLRPRASQEGALTVLVVADRFESGQDIGRMSMLLDQISRALRDGGGVRRSSAVRAWWISRTLNTLFRPGSDEPWIDVVSILAGCDDEELLAGYRARLCESASSGELLASDPELLGRAISAWILAPDEGAHWPTARLLLLDWAAQLHRGDPAMHARVNDAVRRRVPDERLHRMAAQRAH